MGFRKCSLDHRSSRYVSIDFYPRTSKHRHAASHANPPLPKMQFLTSGPLHGSKFTNFKYQSKIPNTILQSKRRKHRIIFLHQHTERQDLW
ncbi:hypothetical protein CEXT_24871 [Caerostris extrusa]|uniref:Uncharacterized protein n=1 Tax=Caerostris extrusa TaxID=172846 RepID=A0AAV4Q4V6_CAEEX|nr:hypothetical protein CEXT_24871 [Caerostris extrusa]